ncbi:hypothetical protein GCM10027445_51540 [Amycolatopsis endophytica]
MPGERPVPGVRRAAARAADRSGHRDHPVLRGRGHRARLDRRGLRVPPGLRGRVVRRGLPARLPVLPACPGAAADPADGPSAAANPSARPDVAEW